MAVTDETWTRLILAEYENEAPTGRYFRHSEHGGLTKDPLQAGWSAKADHNLLDMIELARKDKPARHFRLVRVVVEVVPFSGQAVKAMEESLRLQLIHEASLKLSEAEKIAIGLKNGTISLR